MEDSKAPMTGLFQGNFTGRHWAQQESCGALRLEWVTVTSRQENVDVPISGGLG